MTKRDFPLNDKEIHIGILGMTEGNAHPFSWSAMINGYDKEEMRRWTGELYPTIPAYLDKQPEHTFGINKVRVTHVCFTGYEDREMAENCARVALIEHVVDNPEDMIGKVDAVICATDIGEEHEGQNSVNHWWKSHVWTGCYDGFGGCGSRPLTRESQCGKGTILYRGNVLWNVYCPSLHHTGMVSTATGYLDFVSYLAAAIANQLFANAVTQIGWGNLILVWASLMGIGVFVVTYQKNKYLD